MCVSFDADVHHEAFIGDPVEGMRHRREVSDERHQS